MCVISPTQGRQGHERETAVAVFVSVFEENTADIGFGFSYCQCFRSSEHEQDSRFARNALQTGNDPTRRLRTTTKSEAHVWTCDVVHTLPPWTDRRQTKQMDEWMDDQRSRTVVEKSSAPFAPRDFIIFFCIQKQEKDKNNHHEW